MFSIKENDHFVEISNYSLKSEGLEKNKDRERNYKLESSMRSKNKVIEYALNNQWTHFITITLNPKLINRTDYKLVKNKIVKWFNNFKSIYDNDFKYILIPELHKRKEINGKKAVHFHGFVYMSNTQDLKYIKNVQNAIIYTNTKIKEKFGRNDFTVIYNSKEFIGYYISKYISKSFGDILCGQRYFCSNGLNKNKITIYEDLQGFRDLGLLPTYKNQFVTKWKFTKEEYQELKKYLN